MNESALFYITLIIIMSWKIKEEFGWNTGWSDDDGERKHFVSFYLPFDCHVTSETRKELLSFKKHLQNYVTLLKRHETKKRANSNEIKDNSLEQLDLIKQVDNFSINNSSVVSSSSSSSSSSSFLATSGGSSFIDDLAFRSLNSSIINFENNLNYFNPILQCSLLKSDVICRYHGRFMHFKQTEVNLAVHQWHLWRCHLNNFIIDSYEQSIKYIENNNNNDQIIILEHKVNSHFIFQF
jgi:hypothetical protein